jgi:predicted PurR-regulated permease PerM
MVRGTRSTSIIAAVAVILLLYFGAPFFIPLFISLLIAYALSPVVATLEKVVRYRVLAAAIVVLSVVALMGLAVWTWSDDVQRLWQEVPGATKTLSKSLQKYVKPTGPSAITEVKKAAADIEAAAQGTKGAPAAPAAAPAPAPQVSFSDMLMKALKGATMAITQAVAVLFLVFFMLSSGDLFQKKLLRIAAERNKKRFTMQVLEQIDGQIRRYLLVLLISNILVGTGTWLAFWALGVNYAGLWGIVAGIVHTAPYFGPAIIASGSLVGAFVQFEDWPKALAVAGSSIAVAAVVGQLFATWLASRQTEMNTTATFIGLLFFGWIWGLWGVLLAIPVLAIAKTVCEANEDWKPVAELLGR